MNIFSAEKKFEVQDGYGRTLSVDTSVPLKPKSFENQKHNLALFRTEEAGQSYVHIMGVKVKRASKPRSHRQDGVNYRYTTASLDALRQIAMCYNAKTPIILSGDSGVGKTQAMKEFAWLIGATWHLVACGEDTRIGDITNKPTVSDKTSSGLQFVDGPLLEAARAPEGEVHIVILDEVNAMRNEQTVALHNIIDAWAHNGEIRTQKPKDSNSYETVKLNNSKFYIGMTINPSSDSKFIGRKPLDGAFLRRTQLVQLIQTDDQVMDDDFHLVTGKPGEIQIDKESTLYKSMLYSRAVPLTPDELASLPDINALRNGYKLFHNQVVAALKDNTIGSEQDGEKPEFEARTSQRRILDFICRYYEPSGKNGTLLQVLQKALIFVYVMPFIHETDRSWVLSKIRAVTFEGADAKKTPASNDDLEDFRRRYTR